MYVSDIESKCLDVTHSLKTMVIPFFLTTDLSWALGTVFAYSFASGDAIRANPLIAHGSLQARKNVISMQVINTMIVLVSVWCRQSGGGKT